MKTKIVYFSSSGNTEKIANFLNTYFENEDVTIQSIEAATFEADADIYCLGCPAYGVEDLEIYSFRPYYESLKPQLKDKHVVLFGSYDWGGGVWMDKWLKETEAAEPKTLTALIVENEPDPKALEGFETILNNVSFS